MLALIAAALAGSIVYACTARAAGDADKWGHDSATSEWFRGLKNSQGVLCCDYTDGTRIEDPDYRENDDGSYEVTVGGVEIHVPVDRLVNASNRVGYATLWRDPRNGLLYCFMPGARG